MSRLNELRRFVTTTGRGMEIAPYFNPIVPKGEGCNVVIVDVFDTERLKLNAQQDPNINKDFINSIESVDIVSDASALSDVIAQHGLQDNFDYIVSSHNFEHLPDPIRFLQGCALALRPGGMLTMAIPDYRTCFDHFRAPSRLIDWLAAYHHRYRQPTPEILFDSNTTKSIFKTSRGNKESCRIELDSAKNFRLQSDLRKEYAAYTASFHEKKPYIDTHCSTMFGESLELLLRDLNYLNLINLDIFEITETRGHEFFVHLRKPDTQENTEQDQVIFDMQRERLMQTISASLGSTVFSHYPSRFRLKNIARRCLIFLEHNIKSALLQIFSQKTVSTIKKWNRGRKTASNKKKDSF